MELKPVSTGSPWGELITKTCSCLTRLIGVKKTLLIMNFTAIFLLVTCLTASATGIGQQVTLSEKNAPVEKIFKEIKKQTGFEFLYTDEMLQRTEPITIDLKNVELQDALTACFKNRPLSFSIIEKTIVVKVKLVVVKDQVNGLLVLSGSVKGRVVNENGDPVIATVKVKGTNNQTTTNNNGEFALSNVEENSVLIFSATNIESLEIKLNGKTEITIVAKTRVNKLDEIQIVAYGTNTQRYQVGSVTKITSEDISRQPISNPLAALEGRVPGLVVEQSNGVTGSGFKLQIRGQNSIQQGSVPYIIVDGVPFASQNTHLNQIVSVLQPNTNPENADAGLSPFFNINPQDIESIEVLRDADATSIYGSRGANGVIILTTKKGKGGKTKFSSNIYLGVSKVAHMMDLLNTQQFIKMRREAFSNDGFTPTLRNAADLLVFDTTRYTDFKKMFFGGSANTANINMSLSGGTVNTQFLLGAGYLRETTIFPGDSKSERGSFNFNINHQSQDRRFSVVFSGNFSSTKNNLLSRDIAISTFSLAPNFPALLDSAGNLVWPKVSFNYENPLSFLKRKYSATTDNLISNLQLSYKIFPFLSFRTSFGYNVSKTDEISINPKSSINPVSPRPGTADFGTNVYKTWIVEPQLEFKKIYKDADVTALVGATIQENKNSSVSSNGNGYVNEALMNSLSGASFVTASNGYGQYNYGGLFGRLSCLYDKKYILNLTVRRDGSSRFAPQNRFSNFGSIGAGWIFSNENIFKNVSVISYGKIRGSYGSTGNDQIGNYKYLSSWVTADQNSTYQSNTGLIPEKLYNPDFHWEVNKKLELGLELGFFKDKVLLNISLYRNRCGNQLLDYNLPSQTGFSSILTNFPAVVENSGAEIQLSTINLESKDFKWSTSFNITLPKNKLLSFPNIETSSYANLIVGKSLSTFKGLHITGVDPLTGVYTFEDINHNGVIDFGYPINDNDFRILGNSDPKFYGGIRNTFEYKNFNFDFLFDFKKQIGNNYLYYLSDNSEIPGDRRNVPVEILNSWHNPGDISSIQKYSTVPFGTPAGDAASYFRVSDGVFTDASFIRLRSVNFSYNFPNELLKKWKVSNFKIYLQGQNLFTITNYLGHDPETKNYYSIPVLRTITAGLQITF